MASTDATAIPVKNQAYRVTFPIWDADGDLVTGATGLDSEVSKDAGTFADCTSEATEIATASGMYYLDLTATEMNADTVAIIVKTSSSGAKTTPIILYPQEAADIKVNVTYWNGTAVATPATAGIPDVNVKNIDNDAASASGTVTFPNATLASTTNITAGVITTATNLTTNNDKTGYSLTTAPLDAAGVRTAVGLAAANLDTQLGTLASNDTTINANVSTRLASASYTTPPTVGAIAAQVWDEAIAGHAIAGSTGAALTSAGVAGDPWSVALPGAYGAGTAGKIIGNLPTAAEIALACLLYDWDGITGEPNYCSLQAQRFLRNHWTALLGVLTVYKENGTTDAWTGTLATSDAGTPIIGMTPS